MLSECCHSKIWQFDQATALFGLRGTQLKPPIYIQERSLHAQLSRAKIDVGPLEPKELALPQTGRHGKGIQRLKSISRRGP
jgi:hypothetical protein